MRVAILVADGFTDSGLAVALDVFRTANALARRAGRAVPFQVSVLAPTKRVRAASGLVVGPTSPLSSASHADLVLVPGYWVETPEEMCGVVERPDVKKLVRAIVAAYGRGKTVGSSCAGAFLLAEAGILDGRAATTTWWLAPQLQQRCPRAKVEAESALVVDERLLTAGALFAQADLALHICARVCGPTLSRHVARLLLLNTHASQAAFMAVQQLAANDETVRRAEAWARARLAASFSVIDMARAAGTSPRTLARRLAGAVGATPIGFVQRLRVEQAVHLLETTSLSLDEVSSRVGYRDPNALRRVMRKHISTSPRELRR
ncbi:MAG: helix-turn-helix domain-containing protein [Labilithrix sp.]|nr:helix-turn-helix domain-containing protein [Labilithrix sp.]